MLAQSLDAGELARREKVVLANLRKRRGRGGLTLLGWTNKILQNISKRKTRVPAFS